jgi:hypothetical protein
MAFTKEQAKASDRHLAELTTAYWSGRRPADRGLGRTASRGGRASAHRGARVGAHRGAGS